MPTRDNDNNVASFAKSIDIRAGLDAYLGKTRRGYDIWKVAQILSTFETATFYCQNMLAVPFFKTRAKLHLEALLRSGNGLSLEFGVAGGKSINRAAAAYPDRHFFGFDSFEGLPEAWRPDYQAGHFSQVLPAVPENVTLIEGWFNETLPKFLPKHPGNVGFLHVDCDLYSSTKTIFDALKDRIKPGCVILFDEYFNYPGWQYHEHKAFVEFIEQTGLKFEYIGAVRNNKQVAVVIR